MKLISMICTLTFFAFLMIACQDGQKGSSSKTENKNVKVFNEEDFQRLGEHITREGQNAMLAQVAAAMQAGGVANAMQYCHEAAIPLTDSISLAHGVQVRRVAVRHRNPKNAPQNDLEKDMIAQFVSTNMQAPAQDIVKEDKEEGVVHYFKPIYLGMPTCLKCHGTVGESLAEGDAQLIDKLYPEDKAKGFSEGEFRGLWHLTFVMAD
ncbi:MAG: DUF3365 domain-containing protein [Bernardetiaceae bacterium]|nr:DUF3365 domain-containing protein [Bernardetiaceae bacterium]